MVELDTVMEYLDETFSEYRMYLEQHAGFYGNHRGQYDLVAIDTIKHEHSILISWISYSLCCGISYAQTLILTNYFDVGKYDETFIYSFDDWKPSFKRIKDGLEITESEYYKLEIELLRQSLGRQ